MSENNIICPVMKSPVDVDKAVAAGLTAEHDGKVFFFCCPGCKPKFEANPEEYTAGLPAEDSSPREHSGSCC